MGAGSAKGLSGDEDTDSITSEIKAEPASSYFNKLPNQQPDKSTNTAPIADVPGAIRKILNNEGVSTTETKQEIPSEVEEKKEEGRRRIGLFGFTKRREDEKTNAFVHEVEAEDKKKKEGTKGFKLFQWKKEEAKKDDPKDEHLEAEIQDLQKTFDSLGIVGKNRRDDDKNKRSNPSHSADDIRNLEPMRNRNPARIKTTRSNGAFLPGNAVKSKSGDPLNSSMGGSNRRTFRYSWESETIPSPVKSEEWREFQGNTIEGFDPEKFKMINKKEVYVEQSSAHLPHSVMDNSPSRSMSMKSPPLSYDQKERELLASIEREYFAV